MRPPRSSQEKKFILGKNKNAERRTHEKDSEATKGRGRAIGSSKVKEYQAHRGKELPKREEEEKGETMDDLVDAIAEGESTFIRQGIKEEISEIQHKSYIGNESIEEWRNYF